jgi:hypothetical protein
MYHYRLQNKLGYNFFFFVLDNFDEYANTEIVFFLVSCPLWNLKIYCIVLKPATGPCPESSVRSSQRSILILSSIFTPVFQVIFSLQIF